MKNRKHAGGVDNHEDSPYEAFILSSEVDIPPIKEEMMDHGSITWHHEV